MASGVSFVKQFSESPAEGANTKDAKMQRCKIETGFIPVPNYS